jgi:hypothetical protein
MRAGWRSICPGSSREQEALVLRPPVVTMIEKAAMYAAREVRKED